MTRRSLLAVLVLALVSACGGGGSSPAETEAASTAWSTYRSAILAKDGETAVDRLSGDTIDYYEEVRVLALTANKQLLALRPMVDRLNVVTMRVTFTSEELEGLNGAGLVEQAVARGLIGADGTTRTELRRVKVAGNAASGDLVAPNGRTGGTLDFRKEDGIWKVHLLTLIRSVDGALRNAAQQAGQGEDEFILSAVGAANGKQLTDEIWDPKRF